MVHVTFKESARLYFKNGTCWLPQNPVVLYYEFTTATIVMHSFLKALIKDILPRKTVVYWHNVVECIDGIKFVVGTTPPHSVVSPQRSVPTAQHQTKKTNTC
jgi:hypothetical protein